MDIETLQDSVAVKRGDWNLNVNFVRVIIANSNLDAEEDMVELPLKLCECGYYWLRVMWILVGE